MIQGVQRRVRRVGAALLLAACTIPDQGESATAPDSDDTLESVSGPDSSSESSFVTITDGTPPTTGDTTGVEPTTDDTSGTTTDETTDGTETSDTTGGTSDTSGGNTTESPNACKKKIDILFAVDNNGHMTTAHYNFGQMLPHFIDRVETEFADWDYHMMVVKGDEVWGNEYCEERCELVGNCDGAIEDYPCDHEPDACDMTLGAGVTISAGSAASNTLCPIEGGKRYIQTGQTDLEETLDCTRMVGFSGGLERRQVQSVLDAVSPELNAPGACNDGFLREDAYLIVFMMMVQNDHFTMGTSQEWAETLLATKGGKFDKVFLVGLFEDHYKGGECGSSSYSNDDVYDWVDEIYHSYGGTYCEDYIPHMDEALNYVLDDCEAS